MTLCASHQTSAAGEAAVLMWPFDDSTVRYVTHRDVDDTQVCGVVVVFVLKLSYHIISYHIISYHIRRLYRPLVWPVVIYMHFAKSH